MKILYVRMLLQFWIIMFICCWLKENNYLTRRGGSRPSNFDDDDIENNTHARDRETGTRPSCLLPRLSGQGKAVLGDRTIPILPPLPTASSLETPGSFQPNPVRRLLFYRLLSLTLIVHLFTESLSRFIATIIFNNLHLESSLVYFS